MTFSTRVISTYMTQLKALLYSHCLIYAETRIDTARQAMESAQEAANSESKSSAGDKYETGRAMAQLERDRHATLLAEARKLKQELDHIDAEKTYSVVQPGSLVLTTQGAYFISISAGKITLDGQDYFAVSPASPIATALHRRTVGDTITFNKKPYRIEAVY